MDSLMERDSGTCAITPARMTTGMIVSGAMASRPATMCIAEMKSRKNGMSTKASRLALVMKSRTDSKSRRLLA